MGSGKKKFRKHTIIPFREERQCFNKVRYRDSEVAERVAKKHQDGVQPYRCAFCGAWHIGHKPKSKPRYLNV